MSEYVFRDAPGFGCDMSELMDGSRETVGDYFASNANDHYGTLHEPIVRCRDCKYYDGEPDLESSMPKCWRDPDHKGTPVTTYQDGFCAWGAKVVDE